MQEDSRSFYELQSYLSQFPWLSAFTYSLQTEFLVSYSSMHFQFWNRSVNKIYLIFCFELCCLPLVKLEDGHVWLLPPKRKHNQNTAFFSVNRLVRISSQEKILLNFDAWSGWLCEVRREQHGRHTDR